MAVALTRHRDDTMVVAPVQKRRRVSMQEVADYLSSVGIRQPILSTGLKRKYDDTLPSSSIPEPKMKDVDGVWHPGADIDGFWHPSAPREYIYEPVPIAPTPIAFRCPLSIASLDFVVYEEGFLFTELPTGSRPVMCLSTFESAEVMYVALNAYGTAFLISAFGTVLKVVKGVQCSLTGEAVLGRLEKPQEDDIRFARDMMRIVASSFICS